MTDFDMGIRNGTMRIRDVGNGWVEFWFITGSTTWINGQPWHAFFDGAWHDYSVNIPRGGNWTMFGSTFITNRQDVHFVIDNTGLGWATSEQVAFIERARQPDPPGAPYFWERTSNSIHASFDYGYDGGGGIDDAEIWYSFDGQPRWMVKGRDVWIGGLSPRTPYYFWSKVHNFMGWSDLSARSSAWTIGVPDPPNPPLLTPIHQTRFIATLDNTPYDGGTPIRETQIAYGTDPNTAQVYVSTTTVDATGLVPGGTYYIWARARNDVGWGPWSIRQSLVLPAGALVDVGGQYKRALPWVKVNGVWRLSLPLVNYGGTWRKTS